MRKIIVLGAMAILLGLSSAIVNAQVTQHWVNSTDDVKTDVTGVRCNNCENLVVDSAGNVYVAGYGYGINGNDDYVTIKYDTNGNELWVQRYNGSGNGIDLVNAIAVDGSGNVYVTGQSVGSSSNSDSVTIKYDTNGNELWVQRYNGPSNKNDTAEKIVLDDSGNVYVTGYSSNFSHVYNGNEWYFNDCVTIKYDTNGNELWVQRYGNGTHNRPYDIAVDGSSNVYVTGRSGYNSGKYDYLTIKYDTHGGLQWVKSYNGPVNNFDVAYAVAIDASDNVYVTGSSRGADPAWSQDFLTIKYDTNGNEIWVQRYDDLFNAPDAAYSIATDGFGNVYVTGKSRNTGLGYEYLTIKYDTNGIEQWTKLYDGQGTATAIAVDGSGNVIVTGSGHGTDPEYSKDYVTIKYDTDGNELWVQRYNSTGNDANIATAIAVDGSDNVYVFGQSQWVSAGDNLSRITTIKYGPPDSDGDNILNAEDNCPSISNPGQEDADLDGEGDVCDIDDDNDGILDSSDNCPYSINPEQIDMDEDGLGDVCDIDRDGDSILDSTDNCPLVSNLYQTDTDVDSVGDACDEDDDNDGICDTDQGTESCNPGPDNCSTVQNPDQNDLDGDIIGDACDADIDGDGLNNTVDNCPVNSNSSQDDTDADGTGDACDLDDDNDGLIDEADNCSLIFNPGQEDADNDGSGDICDGDLDGDGVDNSFDNCPSIPNSSQSDFDTDNFGDACDTDIDNDFVNNSIDICEFTTLGEVVDPSTGCAIDQLSPCDNPRGQSVPWKNHGQFMKSVAHTVKEFIDLGLITEEEGAAIKVDAGDSSCGK